MDETGSTPVSTLPADMQGSIYAYATTNQTNSSNDVVDLSTDDSDEEDSIFGTRNSAGAFENVPLVARKSTPNPNAVKKSGPKKQPPTTLAAEPATSSKRARSDPPLLVRVGLPTEPIPGGWPEGWIRRDFQRRGGATVGRVDKYWYPPGHERHKLRSIKEVERYMAALKDSPGNYAFAWSQRKG